MFSYYFDPTYVLVIIAFLLTLFASMGVKSTFSKYNDVRSSRGITAASAARQILDANGLQNIRIEHVSGDLTDHYSPNENVIRLSDSTYNSTSVAAIGVAAHECGHAIQHARGYAPLSFRSALVPVANIGSQLSWLFIILGIFFGGSHTLIMIGILMFSAAVLFQLVTLPVEFNASHRALRILGEQGILSDSELPYTRKVLKAAALTYVASVAASILQLLRLVLLFGGRRRDD